MLDLSHFTNAASCVDAGEYRMKAACCQVAGVRLGVRAGDDVEHGGDYTLRCMHLDLFGMA